MIINHANLNGLFDGFQTRFNEAFLGTTSHAALLAMTVPSNTRQENYAWMGSFPGLREWIGPRHVKNLSLHSYTIVNRPFEMTIGGVLTRADNALYAAKDNGRDRVEVVE